ncbi:MAG: TrbG/VirB9 family P-type conjugative transfer protein [Succinivibrio sp.]
MKALVLFILLVTACTIAHAENYYFESDGVDENDMKILDDLSSLEKRKLKGLAINPGQVQFAFGSGIPSIVCAPLELTDLILERDERMLSVQLGDSARWSVDSVVSGEDNQRVEHLIIKPLDSGIKTSLLIATDKRTYHLRLKASETDFMPEVRFTYPENGHGSLGTKLENLNRNLAINRKQSRAHGYENTTTFVEQSSPLVRKVSTFKSYSASNTTAEISKNSKSIYQLSGEISLMPLTVEDDGTNTYITMPMTNGSEMPALVCPTDSYLSDAQGSVNYHIEEDMYVVEGIYDHLRLVQKSGSKDLYVDIKRNSHES